MSPYLAPSLIALRAELNERWPNRDTASDGWIGDPAHSSRISDHNPDGKGCVHAIDVDIDGINVDSLLKQVIGDPRVWYVIFNRRIYSRTYGWAALVYNGTNPHTAHVHISIRYEPFAETNTATWLGPVRPKRTKGGRLPAVDLSRVRSQARDASEALAGVRRVQAALNDEYNTGLTVDGWWGKDTAKAWRRHERRMGIEHPNELPHQRSLVVLGRGRFRVVR